jgi:DNA polymerase-3 subunit epsilon
MLCHQLGIPHNDHHRAFGDAQATALLFAHLVANDADGHIRSMLKGRNKEQYLPPNVPVEQLDSLPQRPGVYYFYNAAGKVIYVGKAINLLKRVKSHFANNKSNRQKQDFLREIHRISYNPTATDLMAHILESVEIRRLWPVYNRSQRGYHPKFALFVYEDQQGYMRLALDAHRQHMKPLYTFNTMFEGHTWLRRLIEEFGLCPRLCNLAKGADCSGGNVAEGCDGLCSAPDGPAEYNSRVEDAVQWISRSLPTLVLIDEGRDEGEQSCILVEAGIFKGMGYVSTHTDIYDLEMFRGAIEPMPDNDFIRNLVFRHATDHPQKCIRWEGGIMQRTGMYRMEGVATSEFAYGALRPEADESNFAGLL